MKYLFSLIDIIIVKLINFIGIIFHILTYIIYKHGFKLVFVYFIYFTIKYYIFIL